MIKDVMDQSKFKKRKSPVGYSSQDREREIPGSIEKVFKMEMLQLIFYYKMKISEIGLKEVKLNGERDLGVIQA